MTFIRDLLDVLDNTPSTGRKTYTELYDLISSGGCTARDLAQRLENNQPEAIESLLEKMVRCGLLTCTNSNTASGEALLYEVVRAVECDRTRLQLATDIIKTRRLADKLVADYARNYNENI